MLFGRKKEFVDLFFENQQKKTTLINSWNYTGVKFSLNVQNTMHISHLKYHDLTSVIAQFGGTFSLLRFRALARCHQRPNRRRLRI